MIAQLTNPALLASQVDINTCDREPVHSPAAIQSYGVLLVLLGTSPSDWSIMPVGQNTAEHLGKAPKDMPNQPLSVLLSAASNSPASAVPSR